MGKFGIAEDEPIKNSFVTSAIETAQKKIEGFNFDSRRNTLEYDNVLNTQRNSIYARRRTTMFANDEAIRDYLYEIAQDKEKLESIITEKIKEIGEILLGK